jgi:hypothetical protein
MAEGFNFEMSIEKDGMASNPPSCKSTFYSHPSYHHPSPLQDSNFFSLQNRATSWLLQFKRAFHKFQVLFIIFIEEADGQGMGAVGYKLYIILKHILYNIVRNLRSPRITNSFKGHSRLAFIILCYSCAKEIESLRSNGPYQNGHEWAGRGGYILAHCPKYCDINQKQKTQFYG